MSLVEQVARILRAKHWDRRGQYVIWDEASETNKKAWLSEAQAILTLIRDAVKETLLTEDEAASAVRNHFAATGDGSHMSINLAIAEAQLAKSLSLLEVE